MIHKFFHNNIFVVRTVEDLMRLTNDSSVASMEMLHAQTDLMNIKPKLLDEPVVEREHVQPEDLQALLPKVFFVRKIIIDDDDNDLGFYAVHPNTIHIPVSQNVEPKDSFIMGDEHINTTPETEAISVETLVSNPSDLCRNDDTDDYDDYDDDFYDCVDFEDDGGEIDLDISKIVDISLREKLVESYLLIEKINAFNLSPPIPILILFRFSPVCPSLISRFPDFDASCSIFVARDKSTSQISIDGRQSSLS
ncbi:hypothetical protein Tco_0534619 [Tanacetum coccineum]